MDLLLHAVATGVLMLALGTFVSYATAWWVVRRRLRALGINAHGGLLSLIVYSGKGIRIHREPAQPGDGPTAVTYVLRGGQEVGLGFDFRWNPDEPVEDFTDAELPQTPITDPALRRLILDRIAVDLAQAESLKRTAGQACLTRSGARAESPRSAP